MSIRGKVIVVTGGTSGIGEGCSRHFAQRGAKVVIASNQKKEGEALARELRKKKKDVLFVYTDVSSERSVRAMVKAAVKKYGRIDALDCNAGVWRQGKVTSFNDKDWELVMGVNVKGVFYCAKHVVPVMEKQGKGVIVITTSVAAFIGFPEHALYCASKASLEALIRCITTDHAGAIRCVGICPGTIDTPMLAASAAGWTAPIEELYADIAKKIPVRRMGKPVDIAKAAAFLISDDAGYINGVSLPVEGGTLGLPPW